MHILAFVYFVGIVLMFDCGTHLNHVKICRYIDENDDEIDVTDVIDNETVDTIDTIVTEVININQLSKNKAISSTKTKVLHTKMANSYVNQPVTT